jgi:hypothetical protein
MSRVPETYGNQVWRGRIPGTHEPGWVEPPLLKLPVPPRLREIVHGNLDLELSVWQLGPCHIIRAVEPMGRQHELRWHLSISRTDRHPSWDEMKTARYRLLPHDVTFAILLPPPPFYVNVPSQDHVFHMHEIDDSAAPWER